METELSLKDYPVKVDNLVKGFEKIGELKAENSEYQDALNSDSQVVTKVLDRIDKILLYQVPDMIDCVPCVGDDGANIPGTNLACLHDLHVLWDYNEGIRWKDHYVGDDRICPDGYTKRVLVDATDFNSGNDKNCLNYLEPLLEWSWVWTNRYKYHVENETDNYKPVLKTL